MAGFGCQAANYKRATPPRYDRQCEVANLAYFAAVPPAQKRSESRHGTATVLLEML